MVAVGTCVVAAAFLVAVAAVPSTRVRRNYVDGFLFDTVEDASIAGDHVSVVGTDCSDDDSSESIEPAYIIINKREAPLDQLTRSSLKSPASASSGVSSQFVPDITRHVMFQIAGSQKTKPRARPMNTNS